MINDGDPNRCSNPCLSEQDPFCVTCGRRDRRGRYRCDDCENNSLEQTAQDHQNLGYRAGLDLAAICLEAAAKRLEHTGTAGVLRNIAQGLRHGEQELMQQVTDFQPMVQRGVYS